MFLSPWSLALCLGSLVVLVLAVIAARTAVRVLRFWNPASDDSRQIGLESEIWLSSTLMAYGLGFQLLSLILFIQAADSFCEVIAGAMCATGSLLVNPYGMPALLVKLAGVFFYGFWILLHQLDIRSEDYPLVRIKYLYLLFLLPMLGLDIALQTLYIAGIKPDIITSCCAVVFAAAGGNETNLLSGWSQPVTLAVFLTAAFLLSGLAWVQLRRWRGWLGWLYSIGWLLFFVLSLVVITTAVSSYVYAMPYHKCPFCLLKPEYNYYGFALYGVLLPAAFFGGSVALAGLLASRPGMAGVVGAYQRMAVKISFVLLLFFIALSLFPYLRYLLSGGEGW